MIEQNETEIKGSWQMKDGQMIEDDVCHRIRALIKGELHQVAVSAEGWEKLYLDTKDGRYWEWFYPQSEMQGGGPPALRVVSLEVVKQKYHLTRKDD